MFRRSAALALIAVLTLAGAAQEVRADAFGGSLLGEGNIKDLFDQVENGLKFLFVGGKGGVGKTSQLQT